MLSWNKDDRPTASSADHPQSAENRVDGFGLLHIVASTYRRMLLISLSPAQSAAYKKPNTAAMQPSRSSRESGGIGPTIKPTHWRSHRQMPRSPKLRDVARALGVSESVAERRLYGCEAVNLQAAAVIAALLKRGEVEDATAFEAPISAAMMGAVTDDLWTLQRSADESDGYEEVAQAAWIHEKSDEALGLYIRKLAADLFAGSRLLAALKAEQTKRADA